MSFVPVPAAVLNQWVRILGALEKKINRQSFETWLKPTRFSHINGKTLHVRIPSPEFQAGIDRYGDLIAEAIDDLQLEIDEVQYTVPPPDPNATRTREDGGFAPQPSHSMNAPRSGRMGVGPEQSRFDWNTAAQLKLAKIFWPELESNATFFKGGTNDGKTQEFITPGMLIGKMPIHPDLKGSRPGFTFGGGMQIATSHFHTFNHGLIVTGRFIF